MVPDDLSTSAVRCIHFTFGKYKTKSFFNIIIHILWNKSDHHDVSLHTAVHNREAT